MKAIAVLLAAYNGELWIQEQIISILQQRNVSITIFISADLSQDNTLALCENLALSDPRIKLLPYGQQFGGAAPNFYRLLKDVDFSSFDYVAFADQDDIWLDDKLSRACVFLDNYDIYSSNVTAFWADGRTFLIDKAQPQVKYDFLFEAAGPGCTYVMRHDVASCFKKFIIENWSAVRDIELHDWLFYAYARVHHYRWVIDSRSGMHYRQHDKNQVGANNTFPAAVKRFKLIKSKWYRGQVLKLLWLFDDALVVPFKNELLSDNYIQKIKLLPHINEFRRKPKDRAYLAIAILLGSF